MFKFVLIDQSLTDVGGHHYEYARRVLGAAESAGYQPVLAANRKCKQSDVDGVAVHPVYQFGFWDQPAGANWGKRLGRISRRLGGRWFSVKLALLLSPWGALWSQRHDAAQCLRLARTGPVRDRLILMAAFGVLWMACVARAVARIAVAAIPFTGYFARVRAEFKQSAPQAFAPVMVVLRRPAVFAHWLLGQRKTKAFAADTRRLLARLSLEDGDVVFIPTIEPNEMLGISLLFRQMPEAMRPSWHLLYRRNIYTGRDADYSTADEGLRSLRNSFRQFNDGRGTARVFFYTDTDQLTDQYNRLGAVPFATLPIPVDAEYAAGRSLAEKAATYKTASATAPLCVSYVGDARPEKGYHHLPRLVHDVWHDSVVKGRVRFRFQSNFNTEHGEPRAIVGRAQLASFPRDLVQLLLKPLASDEYRELIVDSDLMLVLYDRDNYYARSSGVFAEAMAAGVPTVVPGGSWMALALADAIDTHHASLLQRADIRRIAVDGAELGWRSAGLDDDQKLIDGELRLGGQRDRLCHLDVPGESNYLLVEFRDRSVVGGNFVHLAAECTAHETIPPGSRPRAAKAMIGGRPDQRASALFSVPSGATRIELRWRGAFTHKTISLSDIRFHFLKSPDELPRGAAGVVYTEPDEIADALREVVRHAEHYRTTARQKSLKWAAFHEPANLVRQLLDRAGQLAGSDSRGESVQHDSHEVEVFTKVAA
ncbi:MAG TPA: hypothetical protein VJ783_01105 [Pirellulales bacterium]|nr:hypothetical protein [Pirellulales bacterium]